MDELSREKRAHDLAVAYTLYDSVQDPPEHPYFLDEFVANYERAYEECKRLLSER